MQNIALYISLFFIAQNAWFCQHFKRMKIDNIVEDIQQNFMLVHVTAAKPRILSTIVHHTQIY